VAVTENIVRYSHTTPNVATVTVPVLVAVPAGRSIILGVNAPVTGIVTGWAVSDSKGNTYTVRGTINAVQANYQAALVGCLAATTSLTTSDTITITVTGASPAKWGVTGISADDLTAYDTGVAASGSNSVPSSGATAAGAQNAELVVGLIAWTDTGGTAANFTAGAGFTALSKVTATDRSVALEYGYVNTAGTRTANGTLSSGQGWGAIAGVWKQASPVVDYGYRVRNGAGVWVHARARRLVGGVWTP
jgi:hypothetical protein